MSARIAGSIDARAADDQDSIENDSSPVLEPLPFGKTLGAHDAGVVEAESTDTRGSIDATGESVPLQETGRSKRKRVPKQNTSDALNGCLCGVVLHSGCDGVLKCKRVIFSTIYNVLRWRYPHEIGYAKPVRCLGRVEDQSDRVDDVIFPYIEMCLIT